MNIILVLLTILLMNTVSASNLEQEWVYKKDISLSDLYKARASIEDIVGLSLPSGQQVIVTYVTTAGSKGSKLYRCIEFFNEDMRTASNKCYELS